MAATVKFMTLLSALLLMATMAQAQTVKRYTLESRMIEYEVSGGGNILGIEVSPGSMSQGQALQQGEQMMPCIEKVQNMMDMMKCNQGMQGG